MIFFSIPEEESIQRTFSINVFDHDLLFNSVGQINSMNNSIQKTFSNLFWCLGAALQARAGRGGAGRGRARPGLGAGLYGVFLAEQPGQLTRHVQRQGEAGWGKAGRGGAKQGRAWQGGSTP